MDRDFYLQFLNTSAQDQESFATLKTLIEEHLNSPVELLVQIKGENSLPIITARLEKGGRIVHPQGGMATIPASFGDDQIRLIPLFIYETEKIEGRFLDYEAAHITALLDREGEYKNYKEYFLNTPNKNSSYTKKLAFLQHITRRILFHDQSAFFLLHPEKAQETVRSLVLYQLGERLSWYLDKLEIEREQAVDDLCLLLDKFAASDPFYKDFDVSGYFRQTLIALSMF
ncbi:MAG: hypothetical protein JXR80_05125 [Deltaproteobacteria bacterium]|nr:hypothetical protein [Deltaproteobacteria bacterium]